MKERLRASGVRFELSNNDPASMLPSSGTMRKKRRSGGIGIGGIGGTPQPQPPTLSVGPRYVALMWKKGKDPAKYFDASKIGTTSSSSSSSSANSTTTATTTATKGGRKERGGGGGGKHANKAKQELLKSKLVEWTQGEDTATSTSAGKSLLTLLIFSLYIYIFIYVFFHICISNYVYARLVFPSPSPLLRLIFPFFFLFY